MQSQYDTLHRAFDVLGERLKENRGEIAKLEAKQAELFDAREDLRVRLIALQVQQLADEGA